MKHPDKRAVAASVAAVLLILGGVTWPLAQKVFDNRADIFAYRERVEQLASQRSSAPASSLQLSQELDVEQSGLLSAKTVPEANRKIEAYLLNAVQAKGGDSVILRPTADRQDSGLHVLITTVSARLPGSSTVELLHQLETGSPAIFFDTLRLQGMEVQNTGSQDTWIAMTGTIRVYVALTEKPAP
jgi:hypothetical protein